jgi:hypothetical protein
MIGISTTSSARLSKPSDQLQTLLASYQSASAQKEWKEHCEATVANAGRKCNYSMFDDIGGGLPSCRGPS